MKTNMLKKIATIWFTLLTVFMFSCTSESEDLPTEPTNDSTTTTDGIFTLKASIIDNEGHSITNERSMNEVSFYVFDQNNHFYERLDIDIQNIIDQREIKISCPGSNRITVIAWGGSSDLTEIIGNLAKGSPMSDFILKTSRSSDTSSLPGDLFYGQVVILKGGNRSSVAEYELIMKRKNSSISLLTKGIEKEMDCCYTYKIKSTENGFNCNGVLTGEGIEYTIPAFFDGKGNLTTNRWIVLPSSAITIELYKDNEPVFEIQKDTHQNDLSVKEGNEVTFELEYDTTVSVKTIILPWAYISQDVEF